MNTIVQTDPPEPSPFESYGVLGLILAQAATIRTWDAAHFLDAEFSRFGARIEITVTDEEMGAELAGRLALPEVHRRTQRPKAVHEGQITTSLEHSVRWEGPYAGHLVKIRAYWYTPLGDLDLAEGEELA